MANTNTNIETDINENSKIVVLGNGPSLRNFDFTRLSDINTIGCNAAYRYWDKINWYPDYYCCMDIKLIDTHHKQIKDLLLDGKVKKIFVRNNIFSYHPELVHNDNVHTLENLQGKCKYISSCFPHITTGPFCIRYAMHLGYKNIYILGIDCKYINILPEAESTGGVGLKIIKKVKDNPNYFFDDYQQVGDTYHIANPSGDLHGTTIMNLKKDIDIKKLTDIKIFNCNKESFIFDHNIFPYMDIDKVVC